MILLFALLTFWLGAGQPQLILIAFFICYSLAAFGDGLVGVPWADLAATSMDHRWRARMFGIATVIIGSLMLLVSPLIGVILSERGPAFPNNYALLFGIAGLMFALSTVQTACAIRLSSSSVSMRSVFQMRLRSVTRTSAKR